MQCLEVSGAVRPIYGSLGVKRLRTLYYYYYYYYYIYENIVCCKVICSTVCVFQHIRGFMTCSVVVILTFRYRHCRSQWSRGLRRRSTAARLLRLWVRIPAGSWMSVCYECCVLSGTGLCDALITRPEESYRLCCVAVCVF